MCMNCGCGELDERHKPTDIIREDLQRAADGGGIPIQEAARNLQESSAKLAGGGREAVSAGSSSQENQA